MACRPVQASAGQCRSVQASAGQCRQEEKKQSRKKRSFWKYIFLMWKYLFFENHNDHTHFFRKSGRRGLLHRPLRPPFLIKFFFVFLTSDQLFQFWGTVGAIAENVTIFYRIYIDFDRAKKISEKIIFSTC